LAKKKGWWWETRTMSPWQIKLFTTDKKTDDQTPNYRCDCVQGSSGMRSSLHHQKCFRTTALSAMLWQEPARMFGLFSKHQL
jgi:hypothetical protein